MNIRHATTQDLDAVEALYDVSLRAEEQGKQMTGWVRGIYPTRQTAEDAVSRGDLFVLEADGRILGTGIINQIQVDCYSKGAWKQDVPDNEVCVLHTLIISPEAKGKGLGRAFIAYYEQYARDHGCTELRIDTNAVNARARAFYAKLGYTEVGIVPTVFNGIPNVQLVLLEKYLGSGENT